MPRNSFFCAEMRSCPEKKPDEIILTRFLSQIKYWEMCAGCEFAPLAADQNEVVVLIDPDALDAPVRLAQASEIRNGDHPSFDLLRRLYVHTTMSCCIWCNIVFETSKIACMTNERSSFASQSFFNLSKLQNGRGLTACTST